MSPFSIPAFAAGLPAVAAATLTPATVPVVAVSSATEVTPSCPCVGFLPAMMSSAIRFATSDGIAKPTPMLPDWPEELESGAGDRDVHADHVALRVEQRAAGVARVDRRVGLQHRQVDVLGLRLGLREPAAAAAAEVPEVERAAAPPLPLPPPLELPEPFGTAEEATAMLRFSALTMPVVTVFGRSSGAPIATTGSPTLRSLEFANVAGVRPEASVSLITARSFSGSVPTTFAA